MKTPYFVAIFVLFTNKHIHAESRLLNKPVLNFTQLAEKYGYKAEQYDIETEDGYILGLFRIPGKNATYPVLLMHGIADTSDTWLLRGETSLGITLANRGYDVWFGNVRGNKYSRRHITLNPNLNSKFWDYSFHEYGYYDLSAIIDTILSNTGSSKISAIGHSQGNTMFYVLGSTRPEYNEKINIMTALAPICYLSNVPPPLSLLIKFAPKINAITGIAGINELFGDVSVSGKLIDIICNRVLIGYAACALGFTFPVSGFDIKEVGPVFYNLAMQHFPSSTTRKNLYHFAQVSRGDKFAMYDYGASMNLKKYNSTKPTLYDLDKVTMPVVLLAGMNDNIAVLADVVTLKKQLPNVQNYIVIERKLMNHLDFIWGKNMDDYLFPHIFDALERIN